METARRTAIVKLAAVISVVAALVAVAISTASDVPQAAIVLPVIIVAFIASWIQTGRAGARVRVARPGNAVHSAR